jgi:hypothetical protein
MSKHNNIARTLEHGAVHRFLYLYNRRGAMAYRVLRLQDRPDAVLEGDDGSLVGVEVTHLYVDRREAAAFGAHVQTVPGGAPDIAALVQELNRLLAKKAAQARAYRFPHPMVLVVRCASRAFTGGDFEAVKTSISVPQGAFHEAWLLAQDRRLSGWPHLVRLG